MKRTLLTVLTVAVMAALGWFGFQYQRASHKPIELSVDANVRRGTDAGVSANAPGTVPRNAAAAAPAAAAGQPAAGGGAGGAGGARGPVGVEVAKAERLNLTEEVTAVGNMRANETVMIKPEIAGRIERIAFSDGARVNKGAVLVQLDSSITAAEVEQARAELSLSESSYQRTAELAQRNFVSGSALDQARANLQIQRAKLKLTEARLAKAVIKAPFTGVLGLRNVSVGDFVREGADLVQIEDVSSMKVDLRLPERFLGQLNKGQAVQVAVDAFPGKSFKASINAIDVQVDANGRSVLTRGVLENPEGVLRTGMFAKARVMLKTHTDAIVVPEEALVPVGNDLFVLKVEANKAVRTKVNAGIRRNGKVELLGPIVEGDLVVTAGQLKLPRDGMDVRVIDPNRRPPPGGAPNPGGAGGQGNPASAGEPAKS